MEHLGNTVNGHVWNPVNYGIYIYIWIYTRSTGDRRISEPSTVFTYRVYLPTLFHCTWTSRPDVFHASKAVQWCGLMGLRVLLMLKVEMTHPWKLTWNLKITKLKRTMIFQTSIFALYVNLPGGDIYIYITECLRNLSRQERDIRDTGIPKECKISGSTSFPIELQPVISWESNRYPTPLPATPPRNKGLLAIGFPQKKGRLLTPYSWNFGTFQWWESFPHEFPGVSFWQVASWKYYGKMPSIFCIDKWVKN